MTENHGLGRSNAHTSYKILIFFEEKMLVALDNHAKKINPPLIVFGVGDARKVHWLTVYI